VDYTRLAILAGATLLAMILLTWFARRSFRLSAQLSHALYGTRNILIPLIGLYSYARWADPLRPESTVLKIIETALAIGALWYFMALAKAIFFMRREGAAWQARVPELLIDIGRLALIAITASTVIGEVWHLNLGALLATLGVGSIVLGLALQDTLGSLLAGIALVMERPLEIGHWIRVKDFVGQVIEMNWRAVRLQTVNLDLIVIPNSVIAKESFENYSAPSRIHRIVLPVGFSYQDPPNIVKDVILNVAANLRGVLPSPPAELRTVAFGEFSVNYEVFLYIEDYGQHQRIRDEFMSRLWYAHRRRGITIPFPTSTVYRIDTPPATVSEELIDITALLKSVDLFNGLSAESLAALVAQARIENYARGETIFRQGDTGTAMYIVAKGKVEILLRDSRGQEAVLATRGSGEYFGELTVFAGDARSADARAAADVMLVVTDHQALEPILRQQPDLAAQIAAHIDERKRFYQDLRTTGQNSGSPDAGTESKVGAIALVDRIRSFFHL